MSRDDAPVGKPSAWSSTEPVVAPPVIHRHPLTTSVRVILVLYGLMLAVSFGGVLWIIFDGQHQNDRDRAAVVEKVEADIKKAQAAGLKRDAENNEKTRVVVCAVIRDSFKPTANTRALARQLKCGELPIALSPTPEPAPSPRPTATVYIYRPAPSAQAPPTAPRSSPSPRATRSPSPRPSPSCLLPKPLPCTGNRRR